LQVQAGAFARVHEALLRKYRNVNIRPEQHATYLRLYAVRAAMWHAEAVLGELTTLTLADVEVGWTAV
jgi:hypothetical protein